MRAISDGAEKGGRCVCELWSSLGVGVYQRDMVSPLIMFSAGRLRKLFSSSHTVYTGQQDGMFHTGARLQDNCVLNLMHWSV